MKETHFGFAFFCSLIYYVSIHINTRWFSRSVLLKLRPTLKETLPKIQTILKGNFLSQEMFCSSFFGKFSIAILFLARFGKDSKKTVYPSLRGLVVVIHSDSKLSNNMDLSILQQQLDEPCELRPDQIEFYKENGYIILENVLSPELIEYFKVEITSKVKELNTLIKPMEERTTYEKAFLQVMNLWTKSDKTNQFVFSKRLGKIATDVSIIALLFFVYPNSLFIME